MFSSKSSPGVVPSFDNVPFVDTGDPTKGYKQMILLTLSYIIMSAGSSIYSTTLKC